MDVTRLSVNRSGPESVRVWLAWEERRSSGNYGIDPAVTSSLKTEQTGLQPPSPHRWPVCRPAQGGLSKRPLPPKGVRVTYRYGPLFPTADKLARRVAVRSPVPRVSTRRWDSHVACGSSSGGLIADPGGGQTVGDVPPQRGWLPVLGTS